MARKFLKNYIQSAAKTFIYALNFNLTNIHIEINNRIRFVDIDF